MAQAGSGDGGDNVSIRLPEVYALALSDPMRCSVEERLDPAGFRLVVFDPGTTAWERGSHVGPVLVEAQPDGALPLSVRRQVRNGSLGPWVLVESSRIPRQARCAGGGVSGVVEGAVLPLDPGDRVQFLRGIRAAWLVALERGLRIRFREAVGLSAGTRAALRAIIRQRPSGSPADWSEGRPAVHREALPLLVWLSRQVGMSGQYLARTSRREGIQLRYVDDCWRLVLAISLRNEGEGWEQAAFRLGFTTLGGLHRLASRVVGHGLRQLARLPAGGLGLAEGRLHAALNGIEATQARSRS